MTNILINGLTLEQANIIPLLIKIKYWQNHGCQITIFSNHLLQNKIKTLFPIKNIKYINLPTVKPSHHKYQFIWQSLIRNFQALPYLKKFSHFDMVHSRSSVLDLVMFPFLLKLCYRNQIIWTTIFDNVVPFTDQGDRFIRFLAWIFYVISLRLIEKADLVFVGTKDLQEYLVNRGFPTSKVVLTGNAVDNQAIAAAKPSVNYKYDAVYVGRINETKGIYDILEVLKLVILQIPTFTLAIAGSGDQLTIAQFQQKIKKIRLEKNINLLGWVSEKTKFQLLKSSKMFLFLSKSQCESFGIALLEAVCCGRYAITYNLPPYKSIYQNDEIFSYNIGDFLSVANKIVEIYKQKSHFNHKGQKLLHKFSWEKISKIELDSYHRL